MNVNRDSKRLIEEREKKSRVEDTLTVAQFSIND